MNKILSSFALIILLALSSTSYAGKGTPYSIQGDGSKTEFYAGLKWSLGAGSTPAVVLGIMKTEVESNDDTDGGHLSLDFNLGATGGLGKLKLAYLKGKDDLQGELGVGYDFAKGAPLLGLGFNAPHINAGVDIAAGSSYTPFATLHTLGKFDHRGCAIQEEEPDEETPIWLNNPTCSGPPDFIYED